MESTSRSTGTPPGRSEGSQLTGTFSLGRVRGVSVRAHWSVLIVMALIWFMLARQELPATYPGRPTWQYVLIGAVAAAAFLAGVLTHEVAHAVVARRNGVEVGTVTLWML
ncbi:MAG: hypothetical protein ACXV0U_00295, partial [Kineosporiaceae bacterium]